MDRTRHPTFFLKAFDGENLSEISIDNIPGELFELEAEIQMMVHAVRDGQPVACSGEDGKWSVAMCLAASRSVETGAPVVMSEVC